MKRFVLAVIAGLLVLSFLTDFAMPAEKQQKKAAEGLPGVSVDHRIVRDPPPEPTDDIRDPMNFKVGNTDVHISGYVEMDAGVGAIPPSRR